MKISSRAVLTAAACATIGATAGIVGSAAAPSSSPSSKKQSRPRAQRFFFHHDFGPGRRFGGMAVHATKVELNQNGTGFITVTEDSGKVKSVSGRDVTIAEGLGKVTYKDVSVTLPSGATIYRDGKKAAVGDLEAGDTIHVESSSEGTTAIAFTKSFRPPFLGRDHRGWRDGPPPGGSQGSYSGPPPAGI